MRAHLIGDVTAAVNREPATSATLRCPPLLPGAADPAARGCGGAREPARRKIMRIRKYWNTWDRMIKCHKTRRCQAEMPHHSAALDYVKNRWESNKAGTMNTDTRPGTNKM
ncbi:hypothetical protein NDU88_008261 [Pleurodeles waltl]|uniref:Uncharacterized protein n=1 Tax=Pleurodeles waltl TaxID=8319 RepID=A0AAV7PP91_PLEWA|nr:hypothetical protein NDU88_008261 [Pleurodeles waltl]